MATAKLVIKGEDQLRGPLKQAQQELTGFESVAKKVGDTLKTAFTVTAIIKGVQELSRAVAECINEFKEQIEIDTRLNAVIKATGQQYKYTTQDIKKYASALQEQTRFGDEVIEQSAQLLVATQKFSKEGLERTLELSADLAEAMGTDLTSATSTLSKALIEPGEGLNRLKTIGVSFTDAEEKMIKSLRDAGDELGAQQVILDKVEKAYGGVAKSIGSIDTSTLDKISKVWGDLKQDLGNLFQTTLGPVFNAIYQTIRWLERLMNQAAERVNFNKYIGSGDTKSLANKFTEEYLKEQLDDIQKDYEEAFKTLESNYWLNWHLDRNGMDLDEFTKMSLNKRTDWLLGVSGNDTTFTNMVNQQMVAIDRNLEKIATINEALNIQADDIYEAQLTADSKAAEEAAAAAAAVAQNALDGALNEFGKLSETFKIKELDDNIAQIVELLERDDLGAFNRTVLEEVLQNLQTQRAAYNPIDLTPNPVNTGINFSVRGVDPFGLNNPFNKTTLNGINAILGTGMNLGMGEFWNKMDETFKKYATRSESYQEYLLEQEIDNVRSLLTSAFIDESSPVFTYMNEILDNLELQLAQMKKSDKGDSGSGEMKGKGGLSNIGEAVETLKAAGESVWEDFKSQAGEAGDLINRLTQNMAQFGPILGAIVTALHYVIEGFIESIGSLLNEFVQWGLEPLRELGRMIGEIITPILQEIMPSVIATGKVLMQLFQSIAGVLTPIVQVLMRVIGPVLTVLADVLVTIVGTISWAIDWLAYCITWVLNKVSFGWIDQTAKPGSLSSYLEGMYSDPTTGYESMDSTTGVNAAYSGVTNIYMNVVNNGYVVGDAGLQEFALVIRSELEDLSYYSR